MVKNYPTLKKLVPLFFLLFAFSYINAQTANQNFIDVDDDIPSQVCAGSTITVNFKAKNGNTSSEYYNNSSTYYVYISINGSNTLTLLNTFTTSGVSYCGTNNCITNLQTSAIIPTNLSTGSYIIRIYSASPEMKWYGPSNVFTVNSLPIAPTVGIITQPTCATATGSVFLSDLPATGTWTLTRTPGAITSTGTGTSTTISGLAFGTYTYKVTSASNCTSGASINVVINAQPATPTQPALSAVTQPTCSTSTGSFTITNYNALHTYAVTPSAGVTRSVNTITAPSGSYTVTATSASCTSIPSASAAVNSQPVTPTAPTVGTITQPTCSLATGSVVLSGLPSGSWTINPGAIAGSTATTTISGLAAGTYTYTVTNSSNCTSIVSANVIINAQPTNNVWKGSISTDWNTPGNWCKGVPSITNNLDILIPSASTTTYSPTLSTGAYGYVENILFESGSVLTVENNYLFVKKNLTLNGKIDLNNEAQLVQDTGSTLDALSTGTLEIDQQGTGNSFRYNYWSSPVNSRGAKYTIDEVLRDGNGGTYLNKNISYGAAHTWADGVASVSPAFIKLSTYWMYVLRNSGSGYAAWSRVGNTGEVSVGEGYTMKGSNTTAAEQNYTFVGKPNNGDITLPLNAGFDYLVGNPYPSAIDAALFLWDNRFSIQDGTIHFWEHYGGDTHNLAGYQGGYATRNLLDGTPAASAIPAGISNVVLLAKGKPGSYIPVGQAFFVVGDADGGNIQFKNSQRIFVKESQVAGNGDPFSVFMKNSNTKAKTENTHVADLRPKFRIGFDAPKISHRQLLIGVDERATNGIDWGFDAEIYEVFADDMYWMLNNKKFVIQGINEVGLNSEVPIGIQLSKTGIVTVKIDALENVDEDTSIYLKDKLTGESFNMREKSVELNLAPGTYLDRFALTFKTQKLVAEDVVAELLIPAAAQPIIEGIHVFMNNAMGELQIKNNSTEEIVSVALINALGQTIKSWNSNFNIRTISLPVSTATGVYLVQINTKTGKTVKKISVE